MPQTKGDEMHEFAFQIGDLVCHKAQRRAAELARPHRFEIRETSDVQVGVILERCLTECPGGFQRFYNVRTADTKGIYSGSLLWSETEIELAP